MTGATAHRRRASRASIISLTAALVTAGVLCASAAAGNATPHRCGYIPSRQGRLGVYVARGSVSCATAGRLLADSFTEPGTGLDSPSGWELYKSGWTCQGQMGLYECDYGTRRSVIGLGCALRGCPARTTVPVNDGSADNLTVDRCVPAGVARSGSARGARVLSSREFRVITVHAGPSDLHWSELVHDCGVALAHKTWFVILRPRSGADAHLFAVALANGAWVQLGAYSF